MAVPKSLKRITPEKAQAQIKRHLSKGTGEYEYPNNTGDFIYRTDKGHYWLIREFMGQFETGKCSL